MASTLFFSTIFRFSLWAASFGARPELAIKISDYRSVR